MTQQRTERGPDSPPGRRVTIAAGLVLCGLLLTGCGRSVSGDGKPAAVSTPVSASPSAPTTFGVTGSLQLVGTTFASMNAQDGEECFGIGGYSDIKDGAQVLITDGTGATVALGEIDTAIGHFSVSPRTCDMTFSATDVPAGKGIYSLKIGMHGAPQYTESEIQQGLSLTLGS